MPRIGVTHRRTVVRDGQSWTVEEGMHDVPQWVADALTPAPPSAPQGVHPSLKEDRRRGDAHS